MNKYTQHSKKLSIYGLTQWCIIAAAIIIVLLFADIGSQESEVLSSIVTWSATLAGLIVTGYMGNSSVEKYANRKFRLSQTTEFGEPCDPVSNG